VAGVAPRWCVCNRIAAGQLDVELLCPIGFPFGRATMLHPKIPLLWVVNMGLEARDPSYYSLTQFDVHSPGVCFQIKINGI
jgi:hypothetical protein